MNEMKFNLQFFADGDGGNAGGTEGAADNKPGVAAPEGRKKGDLSNVIYGKSKGDPANSKTGETTQTPEELHQEFEDAIKGKYKDEFTKRTQGIINERFKQTKEMESTLQSHEEIMRMLAGKYGVDAANLDDLKKAIDQDETFYEKEAAEKGLSVKQLKEIKRLENENANLKRAEQEAARRENGQKIYAQWMEQGEAFKEKYGMKDFSFEDEVKNPDFTKLLSNGLSVEAAYKAVHFDDMMEVAMRGTANKVEEKVVNNIASRAKRPTENGVSSQNAATFKPDVKNWSKEDMKEVMKRVAAGEMIYL
jgi:hypothetical protein